MDTTSSIFWGKGPEAFSQYGYSMAKRSDLRQMVIGLLLSEEGFPPSVEVFPGNFSDKLAIEPFLRRMKDRFRVKRVILVCDGGTIFRVPPFCHSGSWG